MISQGRVTRKVFRSIEEARPGPKWQSLFEEYWPDQKAWYFGQGDAARASYGESIKQFRKYMPELVATYQDLTELAGGSDSAARFLAMYCPPAYLSGCTQAVWTGDEPMLVRNYDYSANRLEGVLLKTKWNDQLVIAMSDAMWGVLDGINESGLAVSLAFGGRVNVGKGFGVPIILRYILEFCEDTASAIEVLKRVPTHMSYNITMVDKQQRFATVYITPDKSPVIRQMPVATNHQGKIEWARHAWVTATIERERAVQSILADADETMDGLISGFLRPPVFNSSYARGFGTLYTAVYKPVSGTASYIWPQHAWNYGMDYFNEERSEIDYIDGDIKIFPD